MHEKSENLTHGAGHDRNRLGDSGSCPKHLTTALVVTYRRRKASRWDLRRELSYQQGGDLRGELRSQFTAQDRTESRFENRNQNRLDLSLEARFEPTSELRAELRFQREFENGSQATSEFRLQSRVQNAAQVGCDKGVENAGQTRIPDASPDAMAFDNARSRSTDGQPAASIRRSSPESGPKASTPPRRHRKP